MQRKGEVPNVRLGRSVGGKARERNKGYDRRDIQNCTALSWRHGNECRSREERQCGDIHGNLIRFAFAIQLRDLAEPSKAGVVHQNLDRSSFIGDASLNLRHIGTLREVGDDRFACGTSGSGECSDARKLITTSCHQHQVVAARCQAQGDTLADARRGSRNQCDWTCHTESMNEADGRGAWNRTRDRRDISSELLPTELPPQGRLTTAV